MEMKLFNSNAVSKRQNFDREKIDIVYSLLFDIFTACHMGE